MSSPEETLYALPPIVADLAHCLDRLRKRYEATKLGFTPDGNLVGDIGEAVAAEDYGVALVRAGLKGIDGHLDDGRSVQVKATGAGKRIAFTCTDVEADVLLVLGIDFSAAAYEVVYNGPYARARKHLPVSWDGQKSLAVSLLRGLQDGTGGAVAARAMKQSAG